MILIQTGAATLATVSRPIGRRDGPSHQAAAVDTGSSGAGSALAASTGLSDGADRASDDAGVRDNHRDDLSVVEIWSGATPAVCCTDVWCCSGQTITEMVLGRASYDVGLALGIARLPEHCPQLNLGREPRAQGTDSDLSTNIKPGLRSDRERAQLLNPGREMT